MALTAAIEAAIDDYDIGNVTRISLDEMLAAPKVISVLHQHLGSGQHHVSQHSVAPAGTEFTSGRGWKTDIRLVDGNEHVAPVPDICTGRTEDRDPTKPSSIVRPHAYRH